MNARSSFAALSVVVALSGCNCDDDLYATPGALRGTVCSTATGQGLGGVNVVVSDGHGVTHDALSDALGQFRVEKLAVGAGTVTIAEPGVDARVIDVVIDASDEAVVQDSTCHPPVPPPPPPSGSVSGCVCDDAVGQWVVGANVFVLTDSGGLVVTGTDADGCFVLEGVPEGAQTVKIEKGIFQREYPVTVVAGEAFALPPVEQCVQDPPPPPGDVGSVEGRVCAPDGQTWLNAADAYVELDNGTRRGVQTDAEGHYHIDNVPVGNQIVHIQKGSFSADVDVVIVADQTTVVPEDQCQIEAQHLRIAVVTGDYDRVQDVLGSIGIEESDVDLYSSAFGFFGTDDRWVDQLVLDYATLSQYDIVFLNCGIGDIGFTSTNSPNPQIVGDNLRQFVAEGGSVYASDWAYNVIEKTWPDFVDFFGDDATGHTAKVGNAPQEQTADITDPTMATALNRPTIQLHYPLNAWVVMEAAAPSVTTYVRGDAEIDTNGDGVTDRTLTDVPHTVAFRPGSGRVLYTSFHQEAGINPDMQAILQLLIFEL